MAGGFADKKALVLSSLKFFHDMLGVGAEKLQGSGNRRF